MNRETLNLIANVVASDTQELYDIAKAKGISMPHPALGIFKSVLCEINKANANGVRLAEKATNAAVSTLIGTQINKNHGRQEIMGHTIDSSINKNKEVEVVCIFFKDLYEAEWEEAQELFAKNNLTVSFELSADVESQEKLSDGTKVLNDYYFTGLGLLFGIKPACKKARVFEMATKKLQEKLSMERQSLIFANNQNSQKSILEVLNLMADEVKKIEEVKVEETVVAETPKVEEAKVEEVVYAESEREIEEAAKWTTKFINSLPDSSFAVIEPAYKSGKTTDKNARHLPFKDANGKIDLPHYRNALARANQIKPVTDSISEAELQKEAMAELNKHKDVLKAEEVVADMPLSDVCLKEQDPNAVCECAKCKTATCHKAEEVVAQPMVEEPVNPVVTDQPSTTVTINNEVEKVTVVTDPVAQTQTVTEEKTTTITQDEQVVVEKKETEVTVYTIAQVEEIKAGYEKEIAALKEQISAKDKEVETVKADLEVVKKEKLEAAKIEEPVVLATGHKNVDASEESGSAIGKLLKNRRATRK